MTALKRHPCTAFVDWINKVGTNKIAKTLGVHESNVRHWRTGFVLPRPKHMRKIKELTQGKIGYDAIIEGAQSPLNK